MLLGGLLTRGVVLGWRGLGILKIPRLLESEQLIFCKRRVFNRPRERRHNWREVIVGDWCTYAVELGTLMKRRRIRTKIRGSMLKILHTWRKRPGEFRCKVWANTRCLRSFTLWRVKEYAANLCGYRVLIALLGWLAKVVLALELGAGTHCLTIEERLLGKWARIRAWTTVWALCPQNYRRFSSDTKVDISQKRIKFESSRIEVSTSHQHKYE